MKAIIDKFNSSIMQAFVSRNMIPASDAFKSIRMRFYKNAGKTIPLLPEAEEELLFFVPPPHTREIERYWVDKPYAFVSILLNSEKRSIQYHIVEPRLNRFEKTLLEELSNVMGEKLTSIIINNNNNNDVSAIRSQDRHELLRENTLQLLEEYFDLRNRTFEKIYYYLKRDYIEFGPISGIMKDSHIEDIWCNGVGIPLFAYHKAYGNIRTNVVFASDEELDHFVTLVAQQSSRHISRSTPIVDTVMRDGSRINMTYGHEISPKGSSFSIRRQKEVPLTPLDLIAWGTYSSRMMAYFWLCMQHGKNILFCGGTASGKTSSLNAICQFIPLNVRIVTLEDTREIMLPHKNWVSTITRDGISSNKMGTIDLEDLLRASLRQRPEYLLVGEVRGRESQTLFQAMNAGHATCSTFHAGSPVEVINRFTNPPLNVPPAMFSALDIISMQSNIYDNGIEKRKASLVSEVTVRDNIELKKAFSWDSHADTFEYHGSAVLSEIREKMGWTDEELHREMDRRTIFLDMLLEKGFRDYENFVMWAKAYAKEPATAMDCLVSGKEYYKELVKNEL
jgi:flagellar protein FlaI